MPNIYKQKQLEGEKKQTENKANGEETKQQKRQEPTILALPACTIACCLLKASMSPGFVIVPAAAPWCACQKHKENSNEFPLR